MKKNVLIQLILISAGITTFLSGFTYFVPRIFRLLGDLQEETIKGYSGGNYLVSEIIRIGLGLILVLKSAAISEFITERTGFHDSLTIYTKPAQLFSILLIIIALAHIIEHMPFLFYDIFLLFANVPPDKKGSLGINYVLEQWILTTCHFVVPLMIIFFCQSLTRYFLKNVAADKDKLVIEHEIITIETTDNAKTP